MVARDVNGVLSELKELGAIGVPENQKISASGAEGESVSESPGSCVSARSEEIIVGALAEVEQVVSGLGEGLIALREALGRLREALRLPSAEEVEGSVDGESGGDIVPQQLGAGEVAADVPVASVLRDDVAIIRERLLRRAVEGNAQDSSASNEDDDDAPFVGQLGASSVTSGSGEVTIGTVGTIRPSFPTEGV